MAGVSALHQALTLAGAPLLAGAMREQPLPPSVLSLIRIAAGDDAATLDAVGATGLRAERLRDAARLYIQLVVLAPNADHYRILGVAREAPQAELREHLGWLMKWLHPDRIASEWESVFAQRVVAAWNDLKTPEKRAAYDRSLPSPPPGLTPSGKRRALVRARGLPLIERPRAARTRSAARIATYVVAGAVAATVLLGTWRGFDPAAPSLQAPVASLGGGF